jgi:hypothetical protein
MAAYAQPDFVTSLLAEFPDLRDEIEECNGQLQLEMEAFARFTQDAKARGDMAAYERCLTFADRLFAGADATLGGAFRMSYLEHLEFEGSRGPAAWQLLPPRLQSVWNQIAAENRRLQALPQKHGGQRPRDLEFRPQGGDSRPFGGDKPHGGEGKQRGRKRSPRRGRRR